MIRVDFYVHEATGFEQLALTACRLAEKAFMQSQVFFIHTDSDDAARRVDERLWTFSDRSFIPHAIAGTRSDGELPVVIGRGQAPVEPFDLLINVCARVPDFYDRCARIAELVDGAAEGRADGRARYRLYRGRGMR